MDTVEQRLDMVRAIEDYGLTATEAAQLWGVSRETWHKWRRRYDSEGIAGLADDGHGLALPGFRAPEGLPQNLELRASSHEAGEAACRSLESAAGGLGVHELEQFDRLRESLDRDEAKGFEVQVAFGQADERVCDQDRAGTGELLQTPGEVSRLADGGVVHREVVANVTDDYLARIQPDPDLRDNPVRALELVSKRTNGLLHPECGVARTDRVILVRDRRPEQRHDAVAHNLVHRALEAMHGVDHAIEDRVEEGARLLGVAVGEKLEGPLQVGQQHGDLFALSLERLPALEDLCSQEGRWLRLREASSTAGGLGDGPAASAAEFRVEPVGELADGADVHERGPACGAEAAPVGILSSTLRTQHVGPPGRPSRCRRDSR